MNPPQSSRPLIALIVILVFIGSLGGFTYVRAQTNSSETSEARIARLVREASGQQPVKSASPGPDRDFDDAFREQYRKLFRANQEYMAAVKNADISAVGKLGSPESFANPSSFAEGLKQLHAVYDLDMNQEKKVAQIVDNIRHVIETSSWSASDREGAVRGFDTGIAEPLAKRKTAVSAEQAWVESIDDIYDYAARNHSVITLKDKQLIISDDDVLKEFNSRIETMNNRRSAFLQAKDAYDRYQQDLMRKMGMTPKDVGIQ